MSGEWTAAAVARRAEALGPWLHTIDLHGVATAPAHFLGDYPRLKWACFERHLPDDLRGRSVLDIGCNAGFYTMALRRRGAERVLGIDQNPRSLAQARFAADVTGLDIEYRETSVYDVARLGERFDIVLFAGLLYYLRHPLPARDLIRAHVTRDLLVYQSLQRGSQAMEVIADDYGFDERGIFHRPGYPRLSFIERNHVGDATNCWLPNRACSAAMLRSAGFRVLANSEAEIFIRRHDPDSPARPPECLP